MEDAPRYGGYDTRRPGLLAPGQDATPGFVGGLLGVNMPPFNEQMAARDQERATALAAGMPWGQAATRDMDAPLGLMMGMTAPTPAAGGIRAYHGSPYQFEQFRISENLLRGEGNNMIAPGGYFAGHEPVAIRYRELLSGNPVVGGADAFANMPWLNTTTRGMASHALQNAIRRGLSGDDAVRAAMSQIHGAVTPRMETMTRQAHNDAVNSLGTLIGRDWVRNPGHMYEVNLRTEPGRLLDWDAPLSAQPPQVRENLGRLGISADPAALNSYDDALLAALRGTGPTALPRQPRNPIGADIYRTLPAGSREGAANSLRDAGIPGIQYWDQGSRAAGEGTRNYVIFPGQDEMIQILRRYGLLGPTVVGTGASLFSGQGDTQ